MRTGGRVSSSRHRIGMRLFIWLTSMTILLFILSTFTVVHRQQREIKESLIKEGLSLAGICSESLRTAVFAEDKGMIETVVRGIIMQEGVVSVAVFDESGKALFLWSKIPDYAAVNSAKFPPVAPMTETKNVFEFSRPIAIEVPDNSEVALYADKPQKIKKTVGYVCLVIDKVTLNAALEKVLLLNTIIAALFIVSIALGIYFTVKRITEPFECRMAEMEKMEAVGTLARGIAHDFNNILAAAKGYLYVLRKKLQDNNLSEYVAYTEGSLDRAKKLVESLLAFSNTDRNKFAALDINSVVKSLGQAVGPLAAGRYDYREILYEGDIMVKGDRLQLEQVVMNLVNNALDSMSYGGTLTIQTDMVTLDRKDAEKFGLRADGRFACITVQDTGEGIEAEIKSKIFEPFFTTKEVGKGTGLGLAIVYGIINEHYGFMNVDSIRGEGASFKVYLPLLTDGTKSDA
ncbi:MAG TPA: ATP-binding protein [Dissulfurispiraceae bacterium]|nr:ATP-binding protein [Dissulfurispiraceae bacterium]